MNELSGKHIVLGLTGGIACYKAAELCRALVKEGASVQVVMTEAAEHFITPVTMQALSNRPVYGSQWDAREPNNMAHINLGREVGPWDVEAYRWLIPLTDMPNLHLLKHIRKRPQRRRGLSHQPAGDDPAALCTRALRHQHRQVTAAGQQTQDACG